ncbi:palmitoleoyl-protein carboxylesterase NOTUM [Lutzomyia longipalpis]|uniref:palmitoleoyl-protein carboxylesterase NOTUM n=1 Tax=Lutzomyia longipalpis TaxID=7200 RepID=UPI002483D697|nr:palmitoleoyl-protein carboxylesterase NOTUM [Lutzomyia longipalpis]
MWSNLFLIKILLTLTTFIDHIPASEAAAVRQNSILIESNSVQRVVGETQRTEARGLKRVFLSNRTVACNDGSQAGFYLRRSAVFSRRWIVYLEGGMYCYDYKSCRDRWLNARNLMTSAQWTDTKEVGGILSPHPDENPYWHDANHVIVPYCSSDSWSGTKSIPDTRDGWRFMGSLIVKQVIADLIPLGLGNTQGAELLLAGSSAGGVGVMLNLDKIRHFLVQERGLRVTVRGISDSGWFLDREPYVPGAIASTDVVKQGWNLWNGAVPEACRKKHSREPWRCYFGHRLYPTLKAPLFVFQWLFDEEQMKADGVWAPKSPQQWDYIHGMGNALRDSLENVTAVFAPSCIGHSVLNNRDWLHIRVNNISLSDALKCWEQSTQKIRRKPRTKEERERRRLRRQKQEERRLKRLQKKLRENEERKAKGQGKKAKKNKKNQDRKNPNRPTKIPKRHSQHNLNALLLPKSPTEGDDFTGYVQDEANATQSKRQRKRRKNQKRRHQQNNHQEAQKSSPDTEKCTALRLLERCSWPQCNHSCPTFTNPVTGKKMTDLELLSSFGMEVEAAASALGVDMQTLKNMDLITVLT